MPSDSYEEYEDHENEDGDYEEDYEPEPQKRVMVLDPNTPDEARAEADKLRQKLLDEDLSQTDTVNIANRLALCVSTYGDVNERMSELLDGRPYEAPQSSAVAAEHNALIRVAADKWATAQHTDPISGAALTVAKVHKCQHLGGPFDSAELKSQFIAQVQDLQSSGASREKRIAALAIMSEHCGQAIVDEAIAAPTPEARAITLKHAAGVFDLASRQVERLHKLNQVPSHLFVKGDNHNIAHNQQIVQNRDNPNQLLEGKSNADRSDPAKLEFTTQESHERVDVQKQTVGVKHRAKNSKGQG